MRTSRFAVLAMTLCAFASASALAQTGSGAPAMPPPATQLKPTFDQLDRNKDGAIDAQEAKADAIVSGQFAKLDANGDGKLDRSEFAKAK